jgi:molecular chaperone GrpE
VSQRDPREEHAEPIVRDKRRIDPATGQLREPAAAPAPQPASEPAAKGASPDAPADPAPADRQVDDTVAVVQEQLLERTADLQRLQADFSNYRKRVERDRLATQEMALANVLANLLPILDDIGRAREHGELEGGFKSVAEALEATVGKLGLTPYGEAGDRFDPTIHEALTHSYSTEVTEPTCVSIFQPGYRLGERVVRPARVAVAEPEAAPAGSDAADGAAETDGADAPADGAPTAGE